MKFHKVMESIAYNQKLKRIRVKYDPLNKEHDAFKAYAGYEGFVLQECEGSVSIVIVQPSKDINPVVDLPVSMIVPETPMQRLQRDVKKLDQLKAFIAQKMGEKIGAMISQLGDIVAIETILKDNGIDEFAQRELYKEFILSNEQI